MAEIQPFRGVLYRVAAQELARVLAPPYDVINEAYREELAARDPRNIVRVILNRRGDDAGYSEIGETYRRWLSDGTLAADAEPALYVLEQTFEVDGRSLSRVGLLARFRAEDLERGTILPHEHTRKGPREDRYRVLLATRANFSPIFMMFKDADGGFARAAAEALHGGATLQYSDDGGVAHRLARVLEPARVSELSASLRAARCYIADGHHRYSTALRYRDEHGPEGAWTFGYFTPMDAAGLVVLPYHRVLRRGPSFEEARRALDGRFLLNEVAGPRMAAQDAANSTMPYAFGLAWPDGRALVAEALPGVEDSLPERAAPSLRALDTFFFHAVVLAQLLNVPNDAVDYVHSFAEASQALASGSCALAALMRPTPVRQIVDVAEARESMPAKSTFFHPKLPSGLVIHPLV